MIGKWSQQFKSTFSLVSRLPLFKPSSLAHPDYSRTDALLPIVALLVSAIIIPAWIVSYLVTANAILASALAIIVQYAAFNLFHYDGFLDCADALPGLGSAEQKLAIMKDPRIGSFASFAGWALLSMRLVALSILGGQGMLPVILGLLAAPLAGRTACALIPCISPPARNTGLGVAMQAFSVRRVLVGFLIAAIPLMSATIIGGAILAWFIIPCVVIVTTTLTAVILGKICRRKLGGFTGDVLGAAVELGEVSLLVLLASLMRFYI